MAKGDTVDKDKALKGLKTALQTELNGIEFYRMAADKTTDTKAKNVFKMLANDEIMHFNELQKQFKTLLSSNRWAPRVTLKEAQHMFEGKSPIFSDEFMTRITDKHFEVTALSIGALLETNAVDFYRQMKEETDDPTARELFERLQNWEKGHLDALSRQLDLIKEEQWQEMRFEPLF
jgi:rubrerythrin